MKFQFKHIVIALLFLGLTTSCYEVSELQKESFVKYYGSYQNDYGKDLKVLSNGSYAVLGNVIPDSIARMTLILLDEYGNQMEHSPNYYGGLLKSTGNTMLVVQDDDGLEKGFLLGGSLQDTLDDGTLQTDMYLVRVDTDGDVVWEKTYKGPNEGNDILLHIENRTDGGFVLAGTQTNNGQEDLWIKMVDEDGNNLDEFVGRDAVHDDEANFVRNTGLGYVIACSYNEGPSGGKDFFLISMDNSCNVLDTKVLGTNSNDYSKCIIPYKGAYLLQGYTDKGGTGGKEIALYTFSLEGMLIKDARSFATISLSGIDLIGENCVSTSEGNVAVIGSREANDNADMLLLLLDSDGKKLESPEFGGEGNQRGTAITATADGGLLFVGSNAIEGNSLITLIKTDAKGKL